jgi:hypothetical protein
LRELLWSQRFYGSESLLPHNSFAASAVSQVL